MILGDNTAGAGDHPALAVLWGKSSAAGRMHLLVQHLLDSAAVGERVWDRYLAPATREVWDVASGGQGRSVLVAACGLHDLGKVSPAFQSKVAALAAPVQAAGLSWRPLSRDEQRWHHTVAGARWVRDILAARGCSTESAAWWWPLLAGHHGRVPGARALTPPGRGHALGVGPAWSAAARDVVEAVESAFGFRLEDVAATEPPPRSMQLGLLGLVVMADWIASADDHFPGVDRWEDVSATVARDRAAAAWASLGLRGGWTSTDLGPAGPDPVLRRFGLPARPAQTAVIEVAELLACPGLILVEAPMGEGKTEAALAAVEVLSRRFGAGGVFVGMPTQSTSDPMFARVRGWAEQLAPQVPVALLHGKAQFNPLWRDLIDRAPSFAGIDEYGCDDEYGPSSPALGSNSSPDGGLTVADQAPSQWFLGRKRGLLTPVVVGTVDQLLHAATRTRHVMLRHAGLAGKVVVLDEVHAYDVYMSQFVHEAFRWLAEAGVPVVVLSATLPPAMRTDLVRAYLQGATGARDVDVSHVPASAGYPGVIGVCGRRGIPGDARDIVTRTGQAWRASRKVRIEVLEEPPAPRGTSADDNAVDDAASVVARLVVDQVRQGGCALVVRNTVRRAQQTYLALRAELGDDVVLLHARLTSGNRADRVERVLAALGATPVGDRPARLVVVATQLAEQSFDVDADLLVTDLAPVDLLLQRIGRLHRHDRPAGSRPGLVAEPVAVVTGFRGGDLAGGPPLTPPGFTMVYPEPLLLRAAALVRGAAARGGWSVPADVPALVQTGYDDDFAVPPAWADRYDAAVTQWRQSDAARRAKAEEFLLAGPDRLGEPTLAGLHDRSIADVDDDEVTALVRDGDPSVEVHLVRSSDRGYLTLAGRPLGPNGDGVSDASVLTAVLRDSVRLPPHLTDAAVAHLAPLPGWLGDPWLGHARALVLHPTGADGTTESGDPTGVGLAFEGPVGDWTVRYDHDLGLTTSTRKGR